MHKERSPALVSVIIESLQDHPALQSDRPSAIKRMRGLLKTDSSALTDEEKDLTMKFRACATNQLFLPDYQPRSGSA